MDMDTVNELIMEKRDTINFFKELQSMYNAGMLNNDYFQREIKRLTDEHNGLVEAYNALVR